MNIKKMSYMFSLSTVVAVSGLSVSENSQARGWGSDNNFFDHGFWWKKKFRRDELLKYRDGIIDFCEDAQQIVANTAIVSDNIYYPTWGDENSGFIASDAQPNQVNPNDPLTTTQFTRFANNVNPTIPLTTACKMKSWDAIQFYFGSSSASSGANCTTINKATYNVVSLSMRLKGDIPIYEEADIVFDNWNTYAGSQWSDSSPYTGPSQTAYVSQADGNIHIVGKELYVANDSDFPLKQKVGVDYCQLVSPEYMQAILSGRVTPPSCPDFPIYRNTEIPESPKPWNCVNF